MQTPTAVCGVNGWSPVSSLRVLPPAEASAGCPEDREDRWTQALSPQTPGWLSRVCVQGPRQVRTRALVIEHHSPRPAPEHCRHFASQSPLEELRIVRDVPSSLHWPFPIRAMVGQPYVRLIFKDDSSLRLALGGGPEAVGPFERRGLSRLSALISF